MVVSQERELQRLREENETFPAKLRAAIDEAKELLAEQLKREYLFETELARQVEEGERCLLEQTIAALKT